MHATTYQPSLETFYQGTTRHESWSLTIVLLRSRATAQTLATLLCSRNDCSSRTQPVSLLFPQKQSTSTLQELPTSGHLTIHLTFYDKPWVSSTRSERRWRFAVSSNATQEGRNEAPSYLEHNTLMENTSTTTAQAEAQIRRAVSAVATATCRPTATAAQTRHICLPTVLHLPPMVRARATRECQGCSPR